MTDTRRNFGIKRQRSKEATEPPANVLPGPNGCIGKEQLLAEQREVSKPGFATGLLVEPPQEPKLHVPLGIDESKVVEVADVFKKPEAPPKPGATAEVVPLPTFRNRKLVTKTDAHTH